MYDYNNPMMGRPQPQPMTRGGFDSGVIVFVPAVEDIERVPVMSGEKVYVMAMNDAVIACRTGGNMKQPSARWRSSSPHRLRSRRII